MKKTNIQTSNRRQLFHTIGAYTAAGIGITANYSTSEAQETRNEVLKGLLTVDPALFTYDEQPNRMKTKLNDAHKIAVDGDDNIYVAGSDVIQIFTQDGKERTFSLSLQTNINSIFITDHQILYVGCGNHIHTFHKDGSKKAQCQMGDQKAIITSIGVYEDDIFLADAGNRTILHYKSDGTKQNEIGDFVLPSYFFDIAIVGPNHIYATNGGNHRIERYDFNGNLTAWWGEFSMTDPKGFCGCCNPVSFALLPNKEGFITCEKGIARVKAFDLDGNFTGFLAGPEQFMKKKIDLEHIDTRFNPLGLDAAVDSTGRVLVLDPQENEIRFFTKTQ